MLSRHHIRLVQVSNSLDLNIYAKTPWGPIVLRYTPKVCNCLHLSLPTEINKREVLALSTQLNSLLVNNMNKRVDEAYGNQKRLQVETKQLQLNTG